MKKLNRVKKYQEFQEIFDTKQFKRNDFYKVFYRKNEKGFERYGIVVTKKAGIAVIRNKIKRQLRMMIDGITDYSKSLDIIILITNNYNLNKFEDSKNELETLLSSIRRENEK